MPTYVCRRTAKPIVVDGVLNDAAWNDAEPVRLRLHDDSGFPKMDTLARLCYDDQDLYVAFDCRDTEIQATIAEKDGPIFNEEVVEVFIDPDSDELTYYEFEVSPRNTIFDAIVLNPNGNEGQIDTKWDCSGLRTAVHLQESGDWAAELAIPFHSLERTPNRPPKPGDRWRMNLYRIERVPVQEYMCWSPTLAEPANFHVPGKFGVLEFA
ncbi:MAG: carbohydrate-binding family 9-like protein [Armatimonadota bacterium]|nr:carbohydrate-binding family 9-like protein [Armatimonadota bacterium]